MLCVSTRCCSPMDNGNVAECTTSKKKLCSFVPNRCHNHAQNKVGLTVLSVRLGLKWIKG